MTTSKKQVLIRVQFATSICGTLLVLLSLGCSRSTPSAKEILREAVKADRTEGHYCAGPLLNIFEQQAGQGYYDDALATSLLCDGQDRDSLFIELVKIRAENGDLRGANDMATKASTATLRLEATKAITTVLANKGPSKVPTSAERHSKPLEIVEVREGGPCDVAIFKARARMFSEAYSLIEKNECWFSFVAIEHYESEPLEAERQLNRSTNVADISFGMAALSRAAAKKGSVTDALRLYNASEQANRTSNVYLLEAAHDIAWAWTLRGQQRQALQWARSRSTGLQRADALLGIAQAMGHARPGS